ncbi:hypothetical protein V8E36_000328 [Tilletia maclaganii]
MLLRPTLRLLAQQAYKPSIRFPDRRAASKSSSSSSDAAAAHEPHPHPAAPPEIAKDFTHFQEVFSSGPHFHPEKLLQQQAASEETGGKAAAPAVAEDPHDLPPRYWRTPSLAYEEDELEAVMTGGASLR